MNRKEMAIALHDKKYNCAQAVAGAFCEELGGDMKMIFTACEGLGFGMGGACGTCGAVTGACIAAGLKNSDRNLDNPSTKASTYALSKQIVQKFQDKNGATICKDLKGLETGKMLRSCPDCIMDAVEITEEVLGL